MKYDKNDIFTEFRRPVDHPRTEDERRRWQNLNREWWESHPMRYDWRENVGYPEFSKEFYEEIDRRFFSVVREFMPWKRIPFDPLIDFEALKNQDVLEIGVGNGSHAALLAAHAKTFSGIDITGYAVKSTGKRLEQFGLPGRVFQMDAEAMAFEDDSFDFIWSWGVVHHSSNTRKIIEEMARVLRPGGRAVVMVYYRSWYYYYIMHGLIRGVLLGDLLKSGSIHATVQRYTDGALARYFSKQEWRELVSDLFKVEEIKIFGSKPELVPLPGGRVKTAILKAIPNSIARFFSNRLQMGRFLVARMKSRKPL